MMPWVPCPYGFLVNKVCLIHDDSYPDEDEDPAVTRERIAQQCWEMKGNGHDFTDISHVAKITVTP
jgi:hypothetical protein